MRGNITLLLLACLVAESLAPVSASGGIFCRRLRRNRCCQQPSPPQQKSYRPTSLTCRTGLIATYSFGGMCAYKMYQTENCTSHVKSAQTLNCSNWPTGNCTSAGSHCFTSFIRKKIKPPKPPKPDKEQKGQDHLDSDVLAVGTKEWVVSVTPENATIDAVRYQVKLPGNRWALLLWITPNDGADPIGAGYEIEEKLEGVDELPDHNEEVIAQGQPPGTATSFSINAYIPNEDVCRHYVVRMK